MIDEAEILFYFIIMLRIKFQTIFEFALDSIILQRNKNRQVQIFMIKANKEVAADRKLFQILYNNHHTHVLNLGIKCEPDYQTPLQNFMADLVDLFLRVQNILIGKINTLESRLEEVVRYCARLRAIILSKNRSNKLYSFANSPLSKPNSEAQQSAYKYTQLQNTRKLNTSKYSPQIETQPQTTQKQPVTQQLGNLYFDQKLLQLHDQISQLRQHISFAHPLAPPSQPSIKGLTIQKGGSPPFLFNSLQSIFQSPVQQSHYFQPASKQGYGSAPVARRLSSMRQYWEEGEGTEDEVLMKSELEKCRAVIKQYEKQQAMWRLKLEKYKVMLSDVLKWLKNLKNVQLSSYMPCDACKLKQIIDEYLKATPKTHHHNHTFEQKSDDKESLLMDNDENDIFQPHYLHRNKLSNKKSEQQQRQNIQHDEMYGSVRNRKIGSGWTIQQNKFSLQSESKDNKYIYVEDGDDDVDQHFDDVRQGYGNNFQSDSD